MNDLVNSKIPGGGRSGLLTSAEAAQFLGVSQAFLERDRWNGPTISFIRVGARGVRYRTSDLQDYVNDNLHSAVAK